MPGAVTVPEPEPDLVTVRVLEVIVKAAFTDLEAVMETVQVPVPEHPEPDHPPKTEPAEGEAERVTEVP